MNSSYSVVKIDDINLRKYKIKLSEYKNDVKNLLDILFHDKDIIKTKFFDGSINKLIFDIAFCNSVTMHNINKQYRNKDKTTDVITFALFFDSNDSVIYRKSAQLGQIIINIEKADEQKQSSLKKEILTLTAHGILHLLGFDHEQNGMHDFVMGIQKRIMDKL